VVDGIKFASKKEAARYSELKLLQAAGEITDLKTQSRIPCIVNGEKVCDYYADFSYYDRRTKKMENEDVKGMRTAVYKLKRKLVKACTGIEILET
jgi:hypothetical protein